MLKQIFRKKNRNDQEAIALGNAAENLLRNEVLTEAIARIQENLLLEFHNADLTDSAVVLQIQANRKAFDYLLINLATIADEAMLIQESNKQRNL